MGAVRLFLALIVAAEHLQAFVLAPAHLTIPWRFKFGMNGGFAVMYFYIISGFLISLVLSQKYPPTASGTAAFYSSRFIRIFSLYWPVAIISVWLFWGDPSAGLGINAITGFFPFGLDWFIPFAAYPDFHYESALPGLNQAWTLGAELSFYAAAPWLLRSPRVVWIAFIASALTRAWFVHASGGFDQRWTYMFAPSTFLFFLLGHFAYSLSRRLPGLRHGLIGLACLVTCVVCLMLPAIWGKAAWASTWDRPGFWIATLCFAASLPGISQATKRARFSNALGDLSYPVYLLHVLVLLELVNLDAFPFIFRYVPGSASIAGTIVAVLFLLAVTGSAFLAHRFLETPTARAMRWVSLRLPFVGLRIETS